MKTNIQTFLIVFIVLSSIIGVVLLISPGSAEKKECEGGICDGENTEIGRKDGFLGERGTEVRANDAYVHIDQQEVNDGNMHAFNFNSLSEDKTIYFFIVKANDGTYRVAANACEVCFGEERGFEQVGDRIKCTNCGTTYSKDQVALQKGGCNPGPIDADPDVKDGDVRIAVADIEEVAYLF